MHLSSQPKRKNTILQNRNFLLLFLGTILSTLGDAAYFILLGWFVVDITGSEGALGTALLCSSLPRLIFMLFGGVAADRINRKTILVASVTARTVVLALFGLLLMMRGAHASGIYVVYGMGVIFGFVDAFFWPARGSILPQVVSKEDLSAANSLLSTSQQLSMVIGQLMAAGLFYLSKYGLMFLTLSGFFLISIFLLIGLKVNPSAEGSPPAPTVRKSVFRELGDGIRYVKQIRVISLIMILSLFFNVMLMGPLNIGLPVLVKHLHWTGSDYGYLEGSLGVGAIAGGVLTGVLRGFRGRFHTLPWFVVLTGASFGAIYAMTRFSYGLLAMFVVGVMIAFINIPILTYIQTIVESEYLGRVTGLQTFMAIGLNPVSYAVSSYILQQGFVDANMLFLIGGAAVLLLGFYTASIRDFKTMEDHPAWAAVNQKATAPVEETHAL